MSTAEAGNVVKVAYVGTLEDGTVFDKSAEGDNLQFTVGEQQVIPGFDSAVQGMATGESKIVTIEPEQAYGTRHEEAVIEVTRSQLPDNLEPEVGQHLQAHGEDGQPMMLTIAELSDTMVKLDANHPLAGKALTFEITLNEIVTEEDA